MPQTLKSIPEQKWSGFFGGILEPCEQ